MKEFLIFTNKSIDDVSCNVLDWADVKGIFKYGKPYGQIKLLASEVIELLDAVNKGDKYEEMSELGDILVLCTIIAEMRGFTLEDAYNVAWEKIKDRKGKLNKDGVFVKEA